MNLDFIEAHGFRNLSGRISWGRGLNVIYGNNGQGKTNWLEAIYLVSRTKSFRTQKLQETIAFGDTNAMVQAGVSDGSEIRRELEIRLQGNSKSILVNGKRETLARYLSQIQVFAFTTAELEVVRGAPDARRLFIDRGVTSLRPTYVQTISDYNRVIKQKNRILQDSAAQGLGLAECQDLLAPWNEQLVGLAAEIHRSRTDYVERMNAALERSLLERGDIQIQYQSCLDGKGDLRDYESLISARLRLRLQAEVAAGHALIGTHRDDLKVLLGGREMRAFGSAGQQRSALLLLDLAAISLYNSWHGEYPLFLIDDVDAELDETRIRYLLEHLEGRTQTFITTSKRNHLQGLLSRANVYEIENGRSVENRSENSGVSPAVTAADAP